jgi:retinol dehydrogenase 12
VFIITGGYVGCGYELSKMLYQHNGTVYVAGRSPEKGNRAVEALKKEFPDSQGKAEFLKLDLADLSTIKASVEAFTSKENRLDVLTNNAGVMFPPSGSKTEQVG